MITQARIDQVQRLARRSRRNTRRAQRTRDFRAGTVTPVLFAL